MQPWTQVAAGTRLWRFAILFQVAVVLILALAGVVMTAGAPGILSWVVILGGLVMLVPLALHVRIGMHFRLGPDLGQLRACGTAYLGLAGTQVLLTLLPFVMDDPHTVSTLTSVSGLITVGMVVLGLSIQYICLGQVDAVLAQKAKSLIWWLVGCCIGVVVCLLIPLLLLVVGFAFLFWLNSLTKLLKRSAELYGGHTDTVDVFD
ncbi:MAG: hypothetical protein ACI9U2_001912 [Bradymonadia bacterium]|jgi:hypothetical protein